MEREDPRPLVLVISNYYLPGSRSGGGTRTIVNTVERLSDKFRFRIITRGYDAGDGQRPYDTVKLGEWNTVEGVEVLYLKRDGDIARALPDAIGEFDPSVLYANSFFSPLTVASLRLRKKGKTGGLPFILAPCGELSEGARRLKKLKKAVFIRSAFAAGLYKDLIWKASSELEKSEIVRLGIPAGSVIVAPDLPPKEIFSGYSADEKPRKEAGIVRLVFVSRFDRKKNLKWLLENVRPAEGEIILDAYGTVEDQQYLTEFRDAARSADSGIKATFVGPLDHRDVPATMFRYHFKVMPTLGENFGHVFLEALSAGCPLIISDRTPWSDLEEMNAGWTIPLEDPGAWTEVIGRCVLMEDEEYRAMSASARAYADRVLKDPSIEKRTVQLIEGAVLPV